MSVYSSLSDNVGIAIWRLSSTGRTDSSGRAPARSVGAIRLPAERRICIATPGTVPGLAAERNFPCEASRFVLQDTA